MDSSKSDYNESKEKSKEDINESSDFLVNMLKSKNNKPEKVPFYLDYSWQRYRAIFLTIIFLLFFVFKGIEMYLTKRDFDKFLIKVFNLVSFFALINITIYFLWLLLNDRPHTLL